MFFFSATNTRDSVHFQCAPIISMEYNLAVAKPSLTDGFLIQSLSYGSLFDDAFYLMSSQDNLLPVSNVDVHPRN